METSRVIITILQTVLWGTVVWCGLRIGRDIVETLRGEEEEGR